MEVEIIEIPYKVTYQEKEINGYFTTENSGGNILSPFYIKNQQYLLMLQNSMEMNFKVEGPKDAELMISIINCKEEVLDLSKLPYQNIIDNMSPEFYYEGISHFEVFLKPGKYLIILSNQNFKVIKFFFINFFIIYS